MRRLLPTGAVVALAVVALATPLAGCAGSPAATVGPGPSVLASSSGPSPTDPAFVAVRGKSYCSVTKHTSRIENGNEVVVERFSCQYIVSDPRLSGAFVGDITTTFEPAEAAAARWEGMLTLTNDEGAWTGTGSGVLMMTEKGPYNYGEDRYVGSGAYAGLAFHEFIAGNNGIAWVAGWIEAAKP